MFPAIHHASVLPLLASTVQPFILSTVALVPCLAADVEPIANSWQLGFISLLGIVYLVVSILGHFKRKPTLDGELVKLTTSITSLEKTVEKLVEAKDLHSTHSIQFKTLERENTELRARVEKLDAENRKFVIEMADKIFDRVEAHGELTQAKLDTLNNTVSRVFQDHAKQIGALERAASTNHG